ncbi:MAG: tRNA epoxyqueuosine(34) reductase QueG [Terriglobia bacterium]
MNVNFSETIKRRALDIGFDLAGIAPAAVWQDLEISRQWVEAGYGGEMAYLSNPKRHDPRRVLPSIQSVVCVGLVYNAPAPYSTEAEQAHSAPAGKQCGSETRAWISRYAWGEDYHKVMRTRLERLRKEIEMLAPQAETRVYVDTGPVVERAFARYSGIGWTGKNTCLINERAGSWFFLGVILTNLVIPADMPAADRCGSCTRCLQACPTSALVKPYVMDASRCVAYLTIELRGAIAETLRAGIGSNVFGCDICQDVCPWNWPHPTTHQHDTGSDSRRRAAVTRVPEFLPREAPMDAGRSNTSELRSPETPRPFRGSAQAAELEIGAIMDTLSAQTSGEPVHSFSLFNPLLQDLASLSEQDFTRAFSRSPVKRTKYRGWLRNLCVAMGNSADPSLIPWLEQASKHADPVIREHAVWAVSRLRDAPSLQDQSTR